LPAGVLMQQWSAGDEPTLPENSDEPAIAQENIRGLGGRYSAAAAAAAAAAAFEPDQ